MLQFIRQLKAVQISASSAFQKDNQVLQVLKSGLSVSKLISPLFKPEIKIHSFFFPEEINAVAISARNTSNFLKNWTKISFELGQNKFINERINKHFIALELEQRLFKKCSLFASFNQNHDFASIESFHTPDQFNNFKSAIQYNSIKYLSGEVAINYRFYPNNKIQTQYIWLLSPALKLGPIQTKIGYAFSHSNAQENTFESILNLEKIIDNYTEDQQIDGIYKSYFTPQNQKIHNLLWQVNSFSSKPISLYANTSVSLFSESDIPYIFLDELDGKLFLNKDYTSLRKVNMDIKMGLDIRITQKTELKFNYSFFRNFFYDSGVFHVHLKTMLYREI